MSKRLTKKTMSLFESIKHVDENGVELGNTELFLNTIKNSASKSAQRFVEDIVDLVLSYNGNKRLRDDVTMLVAKIER